MSIINDDSYKAKAFDLLDKCIEIINARTLKGFKDKKYGILGGVGGTALFLSQLCDNTKDDKYDNLLNNCIIQIYDNILKNSSGTLCDGSAGISWVIRQLHKENKLEIDNIDNFLLDIDEINYQRFIWILSRNDFDYLHGSIGMAHYLLNFNIHTKEVCELVINKIKAQCIIDGNKYKLLQHAYVGAGELISVYNLGLSHGMAAIIVVLCEIYNISKDDSAHDLLDGLLNYYRSIFEIRKGKNRSLFPPWIPLEGTFVPESRLAWCYGDAGIYFALNHAAETLNDSQLKCLAKDVAEHTALRMEHSKEWCICHGASGLYYMFNKMYCITGNSLFRDTALKWLGILLNDCQVDNNSSLSILEGVSGIGLSLVNYLYDNNNDWDKILLL